MTNVIRDTFKYQLDNNARHRLELRELQKLVPPFLSLYAKHGWAWGLGIQLTVPFNRDYMAALPGMMKAEGWEASGSVEVADIVREAQTTGYSPKQTFRRNVKNEKLDAHWSTTFYVEITYSTNLEGAKCERVQVGEKTITRTEPVYEFVCKDGAEEMRQAALAKEAVLVKEAGDVTADDPNPGA
jgi:hypothetical protein